MDDTRLVRVTIHEPPNTMTNAKIEALIANAIADEYELETETKVKVTVKAEHVDR